MKSSEILKIRNNYKNIIKIEDKKRDGKNGRANDKICDV